MRNERVLDLCRSMQGLEQILKLSDSFPSSNDSTTLLNSNSEEQDQDIDITTQLTTLRSKYKTVCATLGIRSRMVSAPTLPPTTSSQGGDVSGDLKQMGMSL